MSLYIEERSPSFPPLNFNSRSLACDDMSVAIACVDQTTRNYRGHTRKFLIRTSLQWYLENPTFIATSHWSYFAPDHVLSDELMDKEASYWSEMAGAGDIKAGIRLVEPRSRSFMAAPPLAHLYSGIF